MYHTYLLSEDHGSVPLHTGHDLIQVRRIILSPENLAGGEEEQVAESIEFFV